MCALTRIGQLVQTRAVVATGEQVGLPLRRHLATAFAYLELSGVQNEIDLS
jgi:hypothetical protein